MGKTGCFIVESSLLNLSGAYKKVENQIKAFENAGFVIKTVIMNRSVFPGSKIVDRLPFSNCSPHWEWRDEFQGCDFIYLRKPWLNGSFLSFLKKIKKRNPKAKIIIEFPTYPYDGEMKSNLKDYPKYLKDLHARRNLRRYVDRICSLVETPEIFGINNIKFLNGYDFSQITIDRPRNHTDEIRLCCVANFARWHGYERLLKGLASYYREGGERNIRLYMVGEGSELSTYKEIAEGNQLDAHVEFCGQMDTVGIHEILNHSDFGVASLGLYKADFHGVGCFLKTREYLAAGLPIVCGSKLDIMDMPPLDEYILEYPNDATEIDINKLVLFYDKLYHTEKKRDIHGLIRKKAEEKLDMGAAMSRVIDYLRLG